MPYVVVDNTLGYVKRWGNIDCSIDPGYDSSIETNVEVPDIDLLSSLTRYEVKVVSGSLVEMEQSEKDAVDVAVVLPKYKLKRYIEFDKKTKLLIEQGFEYPPGSGYLFSLTPTAQANLLGTFTARDNPAFTWPLKWPTKLDDYEYVISGSTEFESFYLTALGTIRVCRDSGTLLKDAVRSASSRAEVDAVVDNR